MNPKAMWLIVATLTATAVITLVGCSDGDAAARQELVDFARQMVAEQQAASRSLQSQSAQRSTAAKELVASDATARAELISAGSRLHQGIAQQRRSTHPHHNLRCSRGGRLGSNTFTTAFFR